MGDAVDAGREGAARARADLEQAVADTKRAYADSRRAYREARAAEHADEHDAVTMADAPPGSEDSADRDTRRGLTAGGTLSVASGNRAQRTMFYFSRAGWRSTSCSPSCRLSCC